MRKTQYIATVRKLELWLIFLQTMSPDEMVGMIRQVHTGGKRIPSENVLG